MVHRRWDGPRETRRRVRRCERSRRIRGVGSCAGWGGRRSRLPHALFRRAARGALVHPLRGCRRVPGNRWQIGLEALGAFDAVQSDSSHAATATGSRSRATRSGFSGVSPRSRSQVLRYFGLSPTPNPSQSAVPGGPPSRVRSPSRGASGRRRAGGGRSPPASRSACRAAPRPARSPSRHHPGRGRRPAIAGRSRDRPREGRRPPGWGIPRRHAGRRAAVGTPTRPLSLGFSCAPVYKTRSPACITLLTLDRGLGSCRRAGRHSWPNAGLCCPCRGPRHTSGRLSGRGRWAAVKGRPDRPDGPDSTGQVVQHIDSLAAGRSPPLRQHPLHEPTPRLTLGPADGLAVDHPVPQRPLARRCSSAPPPRLVTNRNSSPRAP